MASLTSFSANSGVTSPSSATNTNARIFVNASWSVYTNWSMNRDTLATEDETSVRITSFGRSFLRCLKISSNGIPPCGMLRRSVWCRSSLPRLSRRRRIESTFLIRWARRSTTSRILRISSSVRW